MNSSLINVLFKRIDRIWIIYYFKDRQPFLKLLSIWCFQKICFSTIFENSFDYVSILLDPPTHHVRKRKHLAYPTHPPFCLRNTWMVPNRRACQFIIFLKVCPPNKKIGPFCPFIEATLSMAHLRVGISKMKRIREKKLFF